jgi:transcriptional regulator with XRE-family HTH domain
MNDALNDFKNFIHERMRSRGFTIKKLSEISGITPKHLQNIVNADLEKLPPAPYLHGYLERLGHILEFDPEQWWQTFKSTGIVTSSGELDQLPQNRFNKPPSHKNLIIAVIAILVVIYFVLRFGEIFGKPSLAVIYPTQSETVLKNNSILLRGRVSTNDEVFINGNKVEIDDTGYWEEDMSLSKGLNNFEIVAKRFLGRETKTLRQVIYEPEIKATSTQETSASSSPLAEPLTPEDKPLD